MIRSTQPRPRGVPAMASAVLATLAATLAFSSCDFFLAPPASDGGPEVVEVRAAGSFPYRVETRGGARDVYFVFSASAATAAPSGPLRVDGQVLPTPAAPDFLRGSAPVRNGSLEERRLLAYRAAEGARAAAGDRAPSRGIVRAVAAEPPVPRVAYTAGISTCAFSEDAEYLPSGAATCRYVSTPLQAGVEDGVARRLVVWVADDCWGAAPAKKHAVDQAMVDALAARFLKDGPSNDIYDWVTAIVGAEWSSTGISELIPFDADIHILLADISGDNSDTGGIVGYFDGTNNFRKTVAGYSASNEKIMFVVDSVMYADPRNADGAADATWSVEDYWPREVFSTLAHEFQHMVHFHQKGILRGSFSEAWLDEMCSLLTEDLLADKLGVPGPRGVDPQEGGPGPAGNSSGRIPGFNYDSYLPLRVVQDFDLPDYSTAYAFGAWAARNYGGARFLRAVVQNGFGGPDAVQAAARAFGGSRGFDAMLGDWAAAVLGSSRSDMPAGFRFNTGGWFASTSGGVDYRLGSIDFFRYYPVGSGGSSDVLGPRCFAPSKDSGSVAASSNVYFLAADDLSGAKTFFVDLPEGVSMRAVFR